MFTRYIFFLSPSFWFTDATILQKQAIVMLWLSLAYKPCNINALDDAQLNFAPKQVLAMSSVPIPTTNGSSPGTAHCKCQTQGPLVPPAEALLASLIKNEASLLPMMHWTDLENHICLTFLDQTYCQFITLKVTY